MALGSGSTLGFPTIALTFIALLIVSQLVLSYTRFGLYIYAIGGDRQAAERMGINVKFVRMSVLVLMAVFTVIGGIVMLGRIASATPNMGASLLLPPIAAVILGGTNLFGGSGNMIGTLVGVLILGSLSNGLNLMGIGPAGQLRRAGRRPDDRGARERRRAPVDQPTVRQGRAGSASFLVRPGAAPEFLYRTKETPCREYGRHFRQA